MEPITVKSTVYDLRIYISGVLHVQYVKEGHLSVDSWIEGSGYYKYFIALTNDKGIVTLEYENKELWHALLKAIDQNI